MDFGKANFIQKALQQPDRVKDVVTKVKNDGLAATARAVNSKLNQPVPMGYSNVGVVVQCGNDVQDFAVGDRVVSNGSHAEFVAVPKNLVAKIPDGVSDEDAAFTILGAVALQGIRLAAPTIGEKIAVFGLGLLGLLTIQILKANGCEVIAFDISEERVQRARDFGVFSAVIADGVSPVDAALNFSDGLGMDAVLITTATQSSDPIDAAAKMSRQRGRIILVGVSGLNLSRLEFFKKNLVSKSPVPMVLAVTILDMN